ncbi:MAG: GGDEF domain-containing protein [Gammaproteobacteria bacterium]|nr:GGDEF domain-containing protein [Gammaproteobacteria bacterium]
MKEDILESIVKITQQRDSDSLEFSLVATLAELFDIIDISILKLIGESPSSALERVVHLSHLESPLDNDDYHWEQFPQIVESNPIIERCLANDTHISVNNNNDSVSQYFPIKFVKIPSGVLKITAHKDVKLSETMISSFLKIYENYQFILNESERDKLTSLLNRRTFETKLSRLLRNQHQNLNLEQSPEQASAWLVMIDIDRFKRVNDTYGHIAGDEILLVLSQIMRSYFAGTDLLFRFGGEEFLLILDPMPLEVAFKTLSHFKDIIASHDFPLAKSVTISLGFAKITPNDYPPTILDFADRALYYAKEHGRNCVFNYEELVDQSELIAPISESTIELF